MKGAFHLNDSNFSEWFKFINDENCAWFDEWTLEGFI